MDDDGRWWTHGRSSGRVRDAVTCSSRSGAISDTFDFDRPVIPGCARTCHPAMDTTGRRSLSNAGDRKNLLASPEVLVWNTSPERPAAGFVPGGEVLTLFGPAPRMRLKMLGEGGESNRVRGTTRRCCRTSQ